MQITHSLRSIKLWTMGLGLVMALGFTSMAQAWGGPYGPVGYRGCDNCVVRHKVRYYRHYYHAPRYYRTYYRGCCYNTCNTCNPCRTCYTCNTCDTCGTGYGYGYGYRYYY